MPQHSALLLVSSIPLRATQPARTAVANSHDVESRLEAGSAVVVIVITIYLHTFEIQVSLRLMVDGVISISQLDGSELH